MLGFRTGRVGHSRGASLIIALLVLLLLAFVGAILAVLTIGNVNFASRQESALSAECLARSGLDYAADQLSRGDWLSKKRPFGFEQNLGRGRIEIEVSDMDDRTISVKSSGIDDTGVRRRFCMLVGKPDVMTNYLLCVLRFSAGLDRFAPGTALELGAGNVAASSITEEVRRVPPEGIVNARALGDPHFAGVIPGTPYVTDDTGEELTFEPVRPSGAGRYAVDMPSGTFLFHRADAGRRVCMFYDYFRMVPMAPNPFVVQLPNAPLRPDSERVFGLNGTLFWRSYVAPTAQANYFMDYPLGATAVSEFDCGRPIRINYAFLGCNFTGPVHINGDVTWYNTNQCFLVRDRGDCVSTSGKFLYAPGSKVSIWTEDDYTPDPRQSRTISAVYRQGQPPVEPPLVNLDWLRKKADPARGGSGWYFDNRADVEISPDQPRSFEECQAELFRLWQSGRGPGWAGGAFSPPGTLIDLSKLPPDDPPNGLIFAEGNIKVFGRAPRARRLTIVSANNIYITGSIWKNDRKSSLALLAERNICINMAGAAVAADTFYVNALLCARRGALAVIPGLQTPKAIIFGAMCVNNPYGSEQWGKAFSSIDCVFDSTLKNDPTRPPYLATVIETRPVAIERQVKDVRQTEGN